MTTAQISKESTRQDVWDFLMKVIKSKTDLGIINSFLRKLFKLLWASLYYKQLNKKSFISFVNHSLPLQVNEASKTKEEKDSSLLL